MQLHSKRSWSASIHRNAISIRWQLNWKRNVILWPNSWAMSEWNRSSHKAVTSWLPTGLLWVSVNLLFEMTHFKHKFEKLSQFFHWIAIKIDVWRINYFVIVLQRAKLIWALSQIHRETIASPNGWSEMLACKEFHRQCSSTIRINLWWRTLCAIASSRKMKIYRKRPIFWRTGLTSSRYRFIRLCGKKWLLTSPFFNQ